MLKLYNTLTHKKEEFVPINKDEVRIYSCGPTVYNYAHIGNMRAYILMDLLRKTLEYNGYKVKQVMNITDVGHMTSDADEGEDKMMKSARLMHMSVYDIAKKYTDLFMNDIKSLNVKEPDIIAKATDHIKEMEEYVTKILQNGYAYETSKGIYFDTSKLKDYGNYLSKNNVEGQKAGARIEVDTEKKNPLDFALWIKAPKEHIMKWDSKYGMCYPGWHIECSAMSKKYLGNYFDIHTGGVDHIPIHHENEIAQAMGGEGKVPAKYFLHTEFLLIDGGKMSKSLGNVYTLEDLKNKGIEPLAFRYFSYTANYTNKLNFTWDAINSAEISLKKLREQVKLHKASNENVSEEIIKDLDNKFLEAINDNMNMPVALSVVWETVKQEKSKNIYELLKKFDTVLSLDIDKEENEGEEIPEKILKLLEERKLAKENKDYNKADSIRDEVLSLGYEIIDTKEGQKVKKKGDI